MLEFGSETPLCLALAEQFHTMVQNKPLRVLSFIIQKHSSTELMAVHSYDTHGCITAIRIQELSCHKNKFIFRTYNNVNSSGFTQILQNTHKVRRILNFPSNT